MGAPFYPEMLSSSYLTAPRSRWSTMRRLGRSRDPPLAPASAGAGAGRHHAGRQTTVQAAAGDIQRVPWVAMVGFQVWPVLITGVQGAQDGRGENGLGLGGPQLVVG